MAHVLINDPQSLANVLRERIIEHPVLQDLGVQVVRVTADEDGLRIRAVRGHALLTVQEPPDWTRTGFPDLAERLVHQLAAEAELSR